MMVADVMTKKPIGVRSDATLAQAAQLMLDNRISGLPVLDDAGDLVGVLTEADIMRRGETDDSRRHWAELFLSPRRLVDDFVRAHARRVDEIMSDPISIDETKSLETAISLMESCRVKRLPVTRAGKLCGILSRSDVMRTYFQRRMKASANCACSTPCAMA